MKAQSLWIVIACLNLSVLAQTNNNTMVVSGVEQLSSGIYDSGSVTATVNGYSEVFPYAQYSTASSIAAGIAAKFSLDCNSPVIAHASGASISFQPRTSGVALASFNGSVVWNQDNFSVASFSLETPALPQTATFACTPTNVVQGQSLSCEVVLPIGAKSPASFAIGGASWASATPDPVTGIAVASAQITQPPGSYSVSFFYPGDGVIIAEGGTSPLTISSSGTSASGSAIYSFQITDQNGNSGYDPVGNITAYADSVNGVWSLQYDALNRLVGATHGIASSFEYGCWNYDSFGNLQAQVRSSSAVTSQTSYPWCQLESGSTGAGSYSNTFIYAPSNQISQAAYLDESKNSFAGAPLYDAAGNITNDLRNQYLYDSDGHVCAVQPDGNAPITGYIYDAEGRRVAKGRLNSMTCDPSQIVVSERYFIGPDDSTMTETDGQGNPIRTEVFAGSYYVGTIKPDGIHYAITDWLGTKRMQVTANGNPVAIAVEESCSSWPFGDVQICNTPLDASPRHFTGKERDTESGLDYFGARYYASSMGRWMSPDWSAKPEAVPYSSLADPQTLNLYAYANNNPTTKRDLDGHWMGWEHVQLTQLAYDRAGIRRNNSVVTAVRNVDGGGYNPYTGYVFHHGAFNTAQDAPGSQPDHFLRNAGQGQMGAFQDGMSRLTGDANAARSALMSGDTKAFDAAMGGAGHLIQDSFAHTDRDGGTGAITHIQCYTCSGAEMDHEHPAFMTDATQGLLSPEAQGAVNATADFLNLMNGAGSMTNAQFQQGLQNYENKWFQQKLPQK